MRVPLVLGKESNAAQASQESVERLLNAYLDSAPTGKEPTPIYGTPGLKLRVSGLDGGIRGGRVIAGAPYVVAGAQLYRINADWTATMLGGVPNADLVPMASDGTNVVMVTNKKIYVWNAGSGLQLVTDPDAPDATSVDWSDGYFIFSQDGTGSYFLSALGDPINYDALDFASAEANPDLLVTPFVHHRILYLPGTDSIEAAQNTGGADFPFARYEGVNIDVGLAGPHAMCHTNDAVFWLASDDTARRMDGLSAVKISNARMSKLIKGWADKSVTVVTAHVFADHLFVVFRNPDGCIVWDQNAERWHERGGRLTTWRARHMFRAYGEVLACSATEGKIYSLDADTFTEDGDVLPFEITTPFAYVQNKRLTVSELEIVAQRGVGSLSLNPQITAERTRDGETWSPRKSRRLGKTGEREGRAQFGPQGQGRAMAFRFCIYDDCRRAVLGAYLEADVEA